MRAAGLETLRREHAAAIKTGTKVDALRTFRQTYYDSFSDDERVKDALEREMKLAYEAIVLNQNIPAWRAYRQTYAFVDDAHPLLAKAYDAEATLALTEAGRTGSVDALIQFEKTYSKPRWKTAMSEGLVVLITGQIDRYIRKGIPPNPGFWASMAKHGQRDDVKRSLARKELDMATR